MENKVWESPVITELNDACTGDKCIQCGQEKHKCNCPCHKRS